MFLARPAGLEPATSGLETQDTTQKQRKNKQNDEVEGVGADTGFQRFSSGCLQIDSTNLSDSDAEHLVAAQHQYRDALGAVARALDDERNADR